MSSKSMDNVINDYRGDDNRYKVCKHKISTKKRQRYLVIQPNLQRKKLPTRSCTNRFDIDVEKLLDDEHCIVETSDDHSPDKDEPSLHNHHEYIVYELCTAIRKNDFDTLEDLLSYVIRDPIRKYMNSFRYRSRKSSPSLTPLMYAAQKGYDEYVRLFLDKRFDTDVNCKFEDYGQSNGDTSCQLWNHVCCDCGYCFIGTGRTALWLACYNGHLNVVRTLIEIGDADVNLSDAKNWTPLRAAISRGHLHIVKYLLEQTKAIIDESRDLFQAIAIDNNEIVDYLLSKGCDPNTRIIDDDKFGQPGWNRLSDSSFALHCAAKFRVQDCAIIRTILDHGGDPTLCDDRGQTILHYAVSTGDIKLIEMIFQYGHTHNQRDNNGYTPLMQAVHFDKTHIVNLLFDILPRQQYIDEIMLLATDYQISKLNEFMFIFMREPFEYFKQAIELQPQISNAIPCEVYEFRRECQIVDELMIIRNDEDAMLIQALLVYERLLPSRGEIHLLISSLIEYVSEMYQERGQYYRCIPVLIHAYTLSLSCKENLFKHWDETCLSRLGSVFCQIISQNDSASINKMIHVFECIFDKFRDVRGVCNLFICITYLIEKNMINNDEKRVLVRFVQRAVRRDFTTVYEGTNLIHDVMWSSRFTFNPPFDEISGADVLRLLIRCGVDVNEVVRNNGSRPLHLIAPALNVDCAVSIINMLIEAGAHTDCLDFDGFLPEQRAESVEIKDLFRSKRTRSLKCRCAHLIISAKLSFQIYLSSNLNTFINMHQGR